MGELLLAVIIMILIGQFWRIIMPVAIIGIVSIVLFTGLILGLAIWQPLKTTTPEVQVSKAKVYSCAPKPPEPPSRTLGGELLSTPPWIAEEDAWRKANC